MAYEPSSALSFHDHNYIFPDPMRNFYPSLDIRLKMMARMLITPEDLLVGTNIYHIMRHCSLFHTFKVPTLPPWRMRKKIKRPITKLMADPRFAQAFRPPGVSSIKKKKESKSKEKKNFRVTKHYFYKNNKPVKYTKTVEIIQKMGSIEKVYDYNRRIEVIKNVENNEKVENVFKTMEMIQIIKDNERVEVKKKVENDVQSFLHEEEKRPFGLVPVVQTASLMDPSTKEKDFKFTKVHTHRLLVYLMKYSNCKTISELKNREITEEQWKKVAKKLKSPFFRTKKYWYYKLHMQLFCPEPIKMKNIIIKFIEHLYEYKYHPVDWGNILSISFDGFTIEFLSHIYDVLLSFAKSRFNCAVDYTSYIDYLYNYHLPAIKEARNTWSLPRLDHILRRKDPLPNFFNIKNEMTDTFDVIDSYVEPYTDPAISLAW